MKVQRGQVSGEAATTTVGNTTNGRTRAQLENADWVDPRASGLALQGVAIAPLALDLFMVTGTKDEWRMANLLRYQ
jgi:hypothetical protein